MIPDEVRQALDYVIKRYYYSELCDDKGDTAVDTIREWQRSLPQVPQPDWEPLEDDEVVTGDFWPTVITVREGNRVDVSNMGFVLPDNIRLCKRRPEVV